MEIILAEKIENRIFQIRGRKVMLDSDLALLYGVETKYLTHQVRRNIKRFPEDFMFKLTQEEFLRCQNVTSKRGGIRYLPYAFTEQGIAMLSSVLNSERAVQFKSEFSWSLYTLCSILPTNLFSRRNLRDWLNAPFHQRSNAPQRYYN